MSKYVYIIAEIGINHNGDINLAKQLINIAKISDCDAVKFQKRTIDVVYTKEELDKPRESPFGTTNREQKEGLEFGKEEYDEIDSYCKKTDIQWFASAWDLGSQIFLKQYNTIHNKIASAMLTDYELLRMVAREGKHTFISTGMSTMKEITDAVEIFTDNHCSFTLMHCNSQYPMPENLANLNMIETLQDDYSCPVGYSGHEAGIIVSVAAVCLGAIAIERHITLDRAMYGSDQAASLEPHGLLKLVEYINVIDNVYGDGIKVVSEAEEKCKAKLRRQ